VVLEEPWKKRGILDRTLLNKGFEELRYIIEHFGNRTFIMGNLGERHGRILPENSMKIIYNIY
jgi:hypothetical protein